MAGAHISFDPGANTGAFLLPAATLVMQRSKLCAANDAMGHQRTSRDVRLMSAIPRRATQTQTFRHFALVPNCDQRQCSNLIHTQCLRGVFAFHYRHDVERHQVRPAGYPALQQRDVVRFQ